MNLGVQHTCILSPTFTGAVESQRVAATIELAQMKRERQAFERVLEAERDR